MVAAVNDELFDGLERGTIAHRWFQYLRNIKKKSSFRLPNSCLLAER